MPSGIINYYCVLLNYGGVIATTLHKCTWETCGQIYFHRQSSICFKQINYTLDHYNLRSKPCYYPLVTCSSHVYAFTQREGGWGESNLCPFYGNTKMSRWMEQAIHLLQFSETTARSIKSFRNLLRLKIIAVLQSLAFVTASPVVAEGITFPSGTEIFIAAHEESAGMDVKLFFLKCCLCRVVLERAVCTTYMTQRAKHCAPLFLRYCKDLLSEAPKLTLCTLWKLSPRASLKIWRGIQSSSKIV